MTHTQTVDSTTTSINKTSQNNPRTQIITKPENVAMFFLDIFTFSSDNVSRVEKMADQPGREGLGEADLLEQTSPR